MVSAGLLLQPALYAQENNEGMEVAQASEESDFGDESDEDSDFSDSDDFAEDASEEDSSMKEVGLQFEGFLELERGGHFGVPSKQEKQWIMDNIRFRLKTSKTVDNGGVFLKVDFIEDGILHESKVDIREARIQYTPVEWMDLSIGKQVNTWGVADMVFINDLFPKNWVSNFLGRDMESMKDSANSYRMSSYFGNWTLDLVYHPDFAPDTTPTGCRFTVYNPNSMLDSSQEKLVENSSTCGQATTAPQQTGEYSHGEFASRLKTQVSGFELALYTYTGFYKNPKGLLQTSATTLQAKYPKLAVYGVSTEGQLGPGIFTFEAGLYQSREDLDGDNALIENSMLKNLFGYKIDVSENLGFGFQVYQERMQQYSDYEQGIINMAQSLGMTAAAAKQSDMFKYRKEEVHNTYTLRIMFKAQQDTLRINLFTYQRPQDHDSFTKLDMNKRLDDNFEVTIGANVFTGEDHYEDRDFGMLRDDDNAFLRLKYLF